MIQMLHKNLDISIECEYLVPHRDDFIHKPMPIWLSGLETTIERLASSEATSTTDAALILRTCLNSYALACANVGRSDLSKSIYLHSIEYHRRQYEKLHDKKMLEGVFQPLVNLCRLARAQGQQAQAEHILAYFWRGKAVKSYGDFCVSKEELSPEVGALLEFCSMEEALKIPLINKNWLHIEALIQREWPTPTHPLRDEALFLAQYHLGYRSQAVATLNTSISNWTHKTHVQWVLCYRLAEVLLEGGDHDAALHICEALADSIQDVSKFSLDVLRWMPRLACMLAGTHKEKALRVAECALDELQKRSESVGFSQAAKRLESSLCLRDRHVKHLMELKASSGFKFLSPASAQALHVRFEALHANLRDLMRL